MEEGNYQDTYLSDFSVRIKDLEEKQRLVKDRVLIIGNNLIETREDFKKIILEMKKQIEELSQESERMKSFLETISGEFSKMARKEDLNILRKQAKMFQPLDNINKK